LDAAIKRHIAIGVFAQKQKRWWLRVSIHFLNFVMNYTSPPLILCVRYMLDGMSYDKGSYLVGTRQLVQLNLVL
jgi:hypothetical protein